jgi:RNA polymerase sigma factor (sigma-70 family)
MNATSNSLSQPKGYIFLIEDDVNLAASLVESLEYLGYCVHAFTCAADFFKSDIFSLSPAVIISDVALPGISGIELQAQLKDLGLLAPVIFISGECSVSETIAGMKQGAIEFLPKPFRREDLNNAVVWGIELDRKRLMLAAQKDDSVKLLAELTPREREVFDLLVSGSSNLQISEELNLSVETIKQYKKQIKQKLQRDSLSQFIALSKKTI